MYGTQTERLEKQQTPMFENDVKMYGTQTVMERKKKGYSLRMM